MSGNGDNNGRASHLDFLRARHEELARDRTYELDIPGYQGKLVVRYGAVPWATLAKSARRMTTDESPEVLFAGHADALIAACREVLFRGDDGRLIPLDPSGEPHRFDQGLADLLGAGTETARGLVLWLFGGDDTARSRVVTQATELMNWLQAVDQDATEALTGE